MPASGRTRTAVLISGGGTNLQAFIDAVSAGSLALDIAIVVSNKADAFGLERAKDAGIDTRTVPHTAYPDRETFDLALVEALQPVNPDLIVLAGFMRILTPAFIEPFAGRILNIHPSLLPKYPGLDTHRRAIEAGDPIAGSTVHFVTPQLDGGPAIVQGTVPVMADDNPATLAARVLDIEHRIYPYAAALYAAGRIRLADGLAWLDDQPLSAPLQFDTEIPAPQAREARRD